MYRYYKAHLGPDRRAVWLKSEKGTDVADVGVVRI